MPFNSTPCGDTQPNKKRVRRRSLFLETDESSKDPKDKFIYTTPLFKHYFKKKEVTQKC